MTIPDWYELGLLVLASWRTWHLLAEDDLFDRSRRWLTRLPTGWADGDRLPDRYRLRLAEFINCPYCFGFWIGLAWWGAFQIWEFGTLVVAVPFAISAGVIAGYKLLSSA